MKKRGYFFTLDAFIAGTILAFGLVLIFSSQVYTREPAQEIVLASSITKLLGYTTVGDVNDQQIHDWIKDGTITNTDNTILEQAGEFYFNNQLGNAASLISNALHGDIPPEQFGVEVIIEDESIFNRSSHEFYEPTVLASSKMIISGVDISTKTMWGPYKAEINIWRRQV